MQPLSDPRSAAETRLLHAHEYLWNGLLCILDLDWMGTQRARQNVYMNASAVGKGRHSDPETGPLLHAAVMRLLNDELKLPTLSPQQLPAAGSLQRARSPHALPPAGRYAGAAAGAHGALDSAGADMLCLDGGPAASGGEVSAAGLKTTPGTVVVGRAALAAWVASKQGDAAAAEQLGADLQ
jgi:hypothetical protein